MKSCEYYQRLISDSLDGPLSREVRTELEQHLRSCPECAAFQETARVQSARLQALPRHELKRGAALIESASAPRSGISRFWFSHVTLPTPLAAGIAAVILGLGIWFALGRRTTSAPGTPTGTVNYVQIERISPQSGVRFPVAERP
jgi:anti-sigma factor RsiW